MKLRDVTCYQDDPNQPKECFENYYVKGIFPDVPVGVSPSVVSVWTVKVGTNEAKLVTAYADDGRLP